MGITVENLLIPFCSLSPCIVAYFIAFVSFSLNSIYSESYKTMLYKEVCNKKVMIWSRCALSHIGTGKSYWPSGQYDIPVPI